MISADSPVKTSTEDRLFRTQFAVSLANAIGSFTSEESFVIGLHGRWGTGKSSLLNLVVEQIEQRNKKAAPADRIGILRFNPWNFSDQNQLILQFLKQFRNHLRSSESGITKGLSRITDRLDEYAEALAPPLELLPYGKAASTALKGAKTLLGTSSRDANAIFEQLSSQCRKSKKRTLVLIDDIDRLNSIEIRQVFQLVKLTARFPYVVYVLAFDRSAVAKALRDSGVDSGEEYLEKIIQVSFDLPPIPDALLTTFITESIDELLRRYQPAHFEMTRFAELFRTALRTKFNSLRQIRRFINGLEFGFGLIASELNGVDFIGIEALRTFYPRTYDVVRSNKESFAGHVDPFMESAGAKAYTDQIVPLMETTGEWSEDLKSLLLDLFPKLGYAYGQSSYGHQWETEWEKKHRVAAERYFDAYFQLSLPASDVSVRDIAWLIENAGDANALLERFKGLSKSGRLKNALSSLRFRLSEVGSSHLPALLSALFAMGETAEDSGDLLAKQIPEYMHVQWAIFDVLDRIGPDQRATALLQCAKQRNAPRTLSNIIQLIEKVQLEKSMYSEITPESIKQVKEAIVAQLRSDPDSLIGHRAMPRILYIWREWGGNAEEPKEFVAALLARDENVIRFVDTFIYPIYSTSKTVHRVWMKPLSEWVNPESLLEKLQKFGKSGLSQHEQNIRDVVIKELKAFLSSGKTPEQFDQPRFVDE